MAKRDYYEVLGVSKSSTPEEIKKAYRKIAMANHPDTHPDDKGAEERFKEASEAYEVLSDPKKKSAYDQYGFSGMNDFAGGAAGSYSNVYRDFSDIFGGGSGGFEDIFSSFFGGGSSRRSQGPSQGESFRYDLVLDFKEAVFGCKKEISITRKVNCETCSGQGGTGKHSCPTCHGTGRVTQGSGFFQMASTCRTCSGKGYVMDKPCSSCHGTGMTTKREKLSVTIPAGVDNGARLTLRGKGNEGENGGPSGDLVLFISVKEDKFYLRDGDDIHLQIPVSIAQASLGAKLLVPMLDGTEVSVEIPAGSQAGDVVTLRGKGITTGRGRTGNFYVHILVNVPKRLSMKAKKLMKDLAGELNETSRPQPVEFKD